MRVGANKFLSGLLQRNDVRSYLFSGREYNVYDGSQAYLELFFDCFKICNSYYILAVFTNRMIGSR